ncbi:ABC transporter ATP-binding protein [Prosthecobacter sp.]|uniref:ABC transporter ATP-binding protein n=1 Tax=Prosthecobacter sp. TaxID=1965333 RepID=UPI00378524B9
MPLIEIKGASKGYGPRGSRTEVLHDINLSLNEGEFVVIVGYSGSGKSTLINLISGLVKPDAGVATISGETITGPGPDRGLVFQNYSLLPWLTVEENIALAVDEVFKDWTAEQRKAHVKKYIEMVKLGHAAHKLPKELSGGMRQRVAVARTLSMNPKVLLLDEPLSALDALTRATIQDEISDIWRQNLTTVLWITNDPDEALLLADRVIPLLPTSPATLGAPIMVDLERPRDRKTLNHDPRFKKLRTELINTLLDAKGRMKPKTSVKLTLPDILPEDLTTVNSLQFLNRSGPRRRSDGKREEVEVAA